MGAYKIVKKSVQNFSHHKVLFSDKAGIYSIVLYKMAHDSLLVVARKDEVLLSSIQSDIVEFDMDLIWIKNNKELPISLKTGFLSRSYELSSKLDEVWQK